MRLKNAKHKGMSLTEATVALIFIGILSAMAIPNVVISTMDKQSLFKTKNIAGELQLAGTRFKQENPGQSVNGIVMADLTKYVAKINDGSEAVLLPNAAMNAVCNGGGYTCYRFPDQSMLAATNIIPVPPITTIDFYYDPDGPGPVPSTGLRYDTLSDRIAPLDAFNGVSGDDPFRDPGYVFDWSKLQ